MGGQETQAHGIAVIRGLAMDAPLAARSGHQGTAMALAPLGHVLFTRILRYDPTAPDWPDRDRFVLSNGHASILLYSLLHLTGYDVSLDDLRAFRQLGSATPGHPERGHTPGVEVTTGPLGQGLANAVGMAIAERWTRARFGPELCDHRVFALCGDGDLQEGISHEAASLAGHLGLDRLVCVYDDNRITIDGSTDLAYSEDVPARFRAYGWHVEEAGEVADDCDALEAALRRAMAVEGRPSLVVLRSHIGWPAPNATDTAAAHGLGLDADEVARTKAILGLPADTPFWVPDDVLAYYHGLAGRGRAERLAWEHRRASVDHDRATYDACLAGGGLNGWQAKLPTWAPGEKLATRKASGFVLDALVDVVPGLIGGGADLTENTNTVLRDGVHTAESPGGRQVFFGIREHGMAAVMNGAALHGGVLPVGGTFFVFSDYMKPAVRLAALSRAHVVFVWTHDSIGVGEDGPTHQPIEQLAGLRAVPGLCLLRPADANETAQAWQLAIEHDGPVGLVLSRQDLPVLEGTAGNEGFRRGAYALEPGGVAGRDLDLVLIGTGSEVHLCVDAARTLREVDGLDVRVVSMPSWDRFSAQPETYRDEVLPVEVPTLAVEAGASLGWDRWADDVVAIDRFGTSAPGGVALAEFGFTVTGVVDRARQLLDDLSPDD